MPPPHSGLAGTPACRGFGIGFPIALPFLLFFILIDGWNLPVSGLVRSAL